MYKRIEFDIYLKPIMIASNNVASTPTNTGFRNTMKQQIGFIGGGQMAEALIKGIIASGLYQKEKIASVPIIS